MRKLLFMMLAGLLSLVSVLPALTQDSTMQLRVAHFSPDAPAVDVYVNGEVAIEALAYPEVTAWMGIEEGNYDIAVAPAGTSIDDAVIGPATFNLVAGTWVTVAAVGSAENGTLQPGILVEDYSDIPEAGFARLSAFHAIEGAPAVNIVANGITLVNNLAYPGTQGGNDGFFIRPIPVGSSDVNVVLASDPTMAVVGQSNVEFEENINYLVAAIGTATEPELLIVATPIGGEMMGDMSEDGMMDEEGDMEDDMMEEDTMSNTIADIVVAATMDDEPNFTVLLAAVQAADPAILEALSNPEAELTVFAPTDEAFAALLEALETDAESLLANTDLLNSVLLYHVIEGAVMAETVMTLDGESVPTLLGEDATISISITDDGVVLNDSINVIVTDFVAENGVVHVIDGVLVPDMSGGEDMSDMEADEDMSDMEADEDMSDMEADEDMMSADMSRWEAMVATTELIGTNPMDMGDMEDMSDMEADEDMSDMEADEDMSDMEADEDMSDMEADEDMSDMEADEDMSDMEADEDMSDMEADEDMSDMEADEDMMMSNTIADIVVASTQSDEPEFTVLLAAVQAADPTILEALSNPEADLTVFAPTDAAFVALLETLEMDAETLLADTELLNSVLLYHVLDISVFSDTVIELDGESVPTLLSEDATISISVVDGGVVLNDTINVIITDFEADNGVVHVIDGVLIPPTE